MTETFYPGVVTVDPDTDPDATDRKRYRGVVDDRGDNLVWVGPAALKHHAQADALEAAAALKRGDSPITGELATALTRGDSPNLRVVK